MENVTIATISPPAGQKARNEMEHTKGKWETNGVLVLAGAMAATARFICSCHTGGWISLEEAEANARRICQCVNNFDALLALVRGYRTTYPLDDYADAADKIIAQVSGGGNNAS